MSCPGRSVVNCNHCEHEGYCDMKKSCGGCYYSNCRRCEDVDCANNVSHCHSVTSECYDCQFVDECGIAASSMEEGKAQCDEDNRGYWDAVWGSSGEDDF